MEAERPASAAALSHRKINRKLIRGRLHAVVKLTSLPVRLFLEKRPTQQVPDVIIGLVRQ
jgi:hypothetical protein